MRAAFRPRPIFLLAAAAASFVAMTCDDAQPIVRLPEKMAEAFCAHQFACCSPFELSTITSDRYKTEEECLPFATIAARQQLGTVDGSLTQGRITIDPAALDACVKAYRDSGCASGYAYPNIGPLPNVSLILAYCPDLFVGHVPDSSACNLVQECRPGSHCASGTPPGNYGLPGVSLTASPGQCVPYQRAGEPCNSSFDCDPAAHLACRDFVCGTPVGEGEPCRFDLDVATGQPISNCDTARRLYCDGAPMSICRHFPRDGEPCSIFQPPPCDPDPTLALSCNPITATCKKPGKEGDACGAPAIAPCRADLACHATQSDGIGICGRLPSLAEACVDRCASPNVCVFGVCTPPGPKPLGSSCAAHTECASLNCMGYIGSPVCSVPQVYPQCVDSDVTVGNISGFGGSTGFGGSGFGGTFITGSAGGRGPPPSRGGTTGSAGVFGVAGVSGTAGAGGTSGTPAFGCQISDLAPEDPIIADFSQGDLVPIGGIFTYGSPASGGFPVATIENGALRVTATTTGMDAVQFWGAGIYFNGNPQGTDCIDGTAHMGVQFDISGLIAGPGCTAQYATNDSAHSDRFIDPKGAGDMGSYAPQAVLTVTATPATVRMPFTGPGAPSGGNPAVGIDRSKLTGVLWQFTTLGDPMSSCNVDITIDNVRFF